MICLVKQFSRSAPVKVKFGIKALSMLSSLALAIGFVSGCTEETPPDAGAPKPAPAAVAPAKPGGPMTPAPAPTPKADEKK
jgi:hypothetical protein